MGVVMRRGRSGYDSLGQSRNDRVGPVGLRSMRGRGLDSMSDEAAATPQGGWPGLVGSTLGLEKEYHVLHAEAFALRDDDALVEAVAAGDFGSRVHAEIATTQL